MKATKIVPKLMLLCLMMTGMGFPGMVSETDAENGKSRSVRYVKVGFLACTRHVARTEPKATQAKCVDKPKDGKPNNGPSVGVASKAGGCVQVIAEQIRRQLAD